MKFKTLIIITITIFVLLHIYHQAVKNGVFRKTSSITDFEKSWVEDRGKENSLDYFLATRGHPNIEDKIQRDEYMPNECVIEDWNRVESNEIPNQKYHTRLMKNKVEMKNILLNKSPSPFSAFAYPDHIAITLTSEMNYSKPVFCRYYDCKMKEITRPFKSQIFPQSTIFCGRRQGAQYISATYNLDDEPEFPVKIVPRITKLPQHYFTVCLSPLYGEEPKFLQIVDFIEYYKLQGATFFHIYMRNVSEYDRVLLDDYVRTGEVEVIKMHDHFWRADFMCTVFHGCHRKKRAQTKKIKGAFKFFLSLGSLLKVLKYRVWHRVQINDCHRRNVNFAKWTAFLDIDERIEMKKMPQLKVVDLLEQMPINVSTIHFSIDYVIKDQQTPEKYIDDNQLRDEMLFRKFTNKSSKTDTFKQPKCIIRPDKIAIMTIHHPVAVYSNSKISVVNHRIAAVRHYRNTYQKLFPDQLSRIPDYSPYIHNEVAPWISGNLTERIMKRVKYVYDIEEPPMNVKIDMYHYEGSEMEFEKFNNTSLI